MYADNELLFPSHVIPQLRHLRGPVWQDLVDRVASLPEDNAESLAFSLLMIRLDGCLSCETDSFRAMRGCAACTQQVLHRYKGPDTDLVKRYNRCQDEVRAHLGLPEETDLAARAA
jgi:hypothetical protein